MSCRAGDLSVLGLPSYISMQALVKQNEYALSRPGFPGLFFIIQRILAKKCDLMHKKREKHGITL